MRCVARIRALLAMILLGLLSSSVAWANGAPETWTDLRAIVNRTLGAETESPEFPDHPPADPSELLIRWLQWRTFDPTKPMPKRPNGGSELIKAYRTMRRTRFALEPTFQILRESNQHALKPTKGESQFLLGNDILVAPVLEEHDFARKVSFPAGRWQNLYERIVYEGPAEFVVPSTLGAPAVFLREGAKIKAKSLAGEQELTFSAKATVTDFSFPRSRAILKNLVVPLFANAMDSEATVTYELAESGTGKIHVLYSQLPSRSRARLSPVADGPQSRFTLKAFRPKPGSDQLYRINHAKDGERVIVHQGVLRWMMPLRLELEQGNDWVLDSGERTVITRVWNKSDERLPLTIRAFPKLGAEIEPVVRDDWLDPNERLSWDWTFDVNAKAAGSIPVRFALSTRVIFQAEAFAIFSRPLKWVTVGPFDPGPAVGHYLSFGPSWRTDPAAVFWDGDQHSLDGDQRLRWEAVPEAHVLEHAGLDFEALYGPGEQQVAYAMTKVRSFLDQPAFIKVGSDGPLAVWVNGRKQWDREHYRPATFDEYSVPTNLKEGVNTIVVKVTRYADDWGFLLRLSRQREQYLSGVIDGFDDFADYTAKRPPSTDEVERPSPLVWHLSQPIQDENAASLNNPGPLDGKFDAAGDWPPEAEGVAWLSETVPVSPGEVLDLNQQLGDQEHAYAYLATTVSLEKPTRVRMFVQSDDGIAMWLNGKQIHRRNRMRTLDRMPDLVKTELLAGENRLLIRLGQNKDDWQLRLNITDVSAEKHKPLTAD